MADELLLLDIYPAGEKPISGVSSETLADEIRSHLPNVTLVNDDDLEQKLNSIIHDGDVILMQGAGSVGQLAMNIMQQLRASA
jgi:UDP-N-acetylmuramate--alanine ligase